MPGPQPCHYSLFILCIVGRGLDPSAGRRGRRPLHSLPQTFRSFVGAGHARPATLPPYLFCGQFVGEGFIPPGNFPLPQTATAARGLAALHMTREKLLTCGASGTLPPTIIAVNPPHHRRPPLQTKILPAPTQTGLFYGGLYPRITSGQSPQPRRTVPAGPAGSGSPSGR